MVVKAIDSGDAQQLPRTESFLSTLGAAAVTLTAPGLPMIFQGEEMLENQSFDSGLLVDWTKTNTYSAVVQFYRDLITARRDLKGYTQGLEGDQCSVFLTNNTSKVVAFRRWKSAAPNQAAVVIGNFGSNTLNNYSITFPSAGNWYVHLNSDSTVYGSDYGNIGSTIVTASGSPAHANVTIGPYSALIMSQTPDAPPQLTITPTNGGVNVSWLQRRISSGQLLREHLPDGRRRGMGAGSAGAMPEQRHDDVGQRGPAEREQFLSVAEELKLNHGFTRIRTDGEWRI